MLIYLEKNLKAMIEFRFNFLLSTIAMVISNFIFMATILYLLYTVGSVGNLSFEEVLVGFAIGNLTYVFSLNFFRGITQSSKLIINGELDRLLLRPISVYKHILMYKLNPYGLAEILTAAIFLFLVDFSWWPFIFAVSALVGVIAHCFVFAIHLIPLFIDMNEDIGFFDMFITGMFYPPDMFVSWMKILIMFVIPGALVSFGGVMALHEPYLWFVLFCYAIGSVVVLWAMFYFGLKKYRSAGY